MQTKRCNCGSDVDLMGHAESVKFKFFGFGLTAAAIEISGIGFKSASCCPQKDPKEVEVAYIDWKTKKVCKFVLPLEFNERR